MATKKKKKPKSNPKKVVDQKGPEPTKEVASVADSQPDLSDFEKSLAEDLEKLIGRPIFCGSGELETDVRFWFPSGIHILDRVLGGGFPSGRLSEILGEDRRGKTALAISVATQCQRLGGYVFYIDTEGTFDSKFASRLGLDISKKFMHVLLDKIEDCVLCINRFVESICKSFDDPLALIVVDSIANAATLEDLDYVYKDGKELKVPAVAPAARKLARVFRVGLTKQLAHFDKGRIALIFINQLKESPTKGLVSYGGRGIKYQASLRIKLDQRDYLYDHSNNKIGIIIEVDVLKNKLAIPFKKVLVCLNHYTGFDNELSTIFSLETKKVFGDKSGWLLWNDKYYRRSQLLELFRSDPDQYKSALDMADEFI